MAFVLGSKIKIGSFSFQGVHEVRIKKSIRNYINTGVIKLPAKCRVLKRDGSSIVELETGKQFSEGDPVKVELAYNGDYRQEFEGFVRRVNFNIPLEVEIEGYSWQLRRNNVKRSWAKTTVKEVLTEAIKGTDIVLQVETDVPLVNVVMTTGMTGADVLDYILDKATDGALKAFFLDAKTLWVGLQYTAHKNTVKYVLGKNVIRDNQLKECIKEKTNVIIVYKHKEPSGTKHKGEAKHHNAKANTISKVRNKMLQHIADSSILEKLAAAKLQDVNYTGYEGKINSFLQPYAEPGDKIVLVDNRYEIKGGSYIADSVEVIYGRNGARRIVEIGAKIL